MSKMSLSLQEKQLTVFVANAQSPTFKSKLEFWKIYICNCELNSFQTLEYFGDEIGAINKGVVVKKYICI
jgi:hypothetical protein